MSLGLIIWSFDPLTVKFSSVSVLYDDFFDFGPSSIKLHHHQSEPRNHQQFIDSGHLRRSGQTSPFSLFSPIRDQCGSSSHKQPIRITFLSAPHKLWINVICIFEYFQRHCKQIPNIYAFHLTMKIVTRKELKIREILLTKREKNALGLDFEKRK